MKNLCGQCNDGWRNDRKAANSLSGEPCGCEQYVCDETAEDLSESEIEANLEMFGQSREHYCQEVLDKLKEGVFV